LRLITLNNLSFLISPVLIVVHLVEVSSPLNAEVIAAPSLFVCCRISCAEVYPDLILVYFACWGIFVISRLQDAHLEVSLPPNMYTSPPRVETKMSRTLHTIMIWAEATSAIRA